MMNRSASFKLAAWPCLLALAALLCAFAARGQSPVGYPFPQNVDYGRGTRPKNHTESQMNDDCVRFYAAWLSDCVTTNGCPSGACRVDVGSYVPDILTPHDTASEGIAWGMLITALMDNQTNHAKKIFDSLNRYREAFTNANGLMNWRISSNGVVLGPGAATEADENMAMALLYADKKWGSTGPTDYLRQATNLIQAIMEKEVEPSTFVLKPGDTFGGSTLLNPCYFDTAFYRVWETVTGDSHWRRVTAACRPVMEYFHTNYTTGLAPDWCQASGRPAGSLDYSFHYNACQVPLKSAIDYAWFGSSNDDLAFLDNDRLVAWICARTGGNPSLIVDGYRLDGTPTGAYPNATAFIAPLLCASMCSADHQAFCDKLYDKLVALPAGRPYGYYGDTLRLACLLLATGNMPNLWPR